MSPRLDATSWIHLFATVDCPLVGEGFAELALRPPDPGHVIHTQAVVECAAPRKWRI